VTNLETMGMGPSSLARAAAGAAGSGNKIGGPSRLGDLLVGQLGHPRGALGRLVLRRMNRTNRRLIAGCIGAIAPQTGHAVADIGFGGGLGIELLTEHVGLTGIVTGIEPSELARKRAVNHFTEEIALDRVRIYSGVVSRLPLDDATQNGVISVNTVYHWADLDVGLREILRVLTPGGVAALGIIDLERQRRLRLETRAERAISANELMDAMRRNGFDRVSIASPRGPEGRAIARGYRPV